MKWMKNKKYTMPLVLGLLLFPGLPLLAGPLPSPIKNGGFESAQVTPWKTDSAGIAVDSSVKHSGNRSMKVTGGPEARSLTGGKFPIDIDTVYTVSLWIKTQAISTPDGVSVKIFQRNDSTGWNSRYPTTHNDQPVERKVIKTGGTQDWTEYKFSFTPDAAAEFVEFSLDMDPGIAGTAWIDDVTLSLTSTRIAQRDFTGGWHNVKVWGDQVRWVEKSGAEDHLEITLPQGEYMVWLSQMGGNRPDIEVAADGKVLGTGDGMKPTGWQQIGKVALAAGAHHFTLTSKDPNGFKNQTAYAGMILSTDPDAKLPDWSERFSTPLETLPVTLSPARPSDKKLVMVFSAYLVETGWVELGAAGFPASGAARIAAVAHKYGIPVTWLVDNRSAVKMKDLLTKWHNEFGDDVASFDWKDWGPVKAALPWASTTSAAVGVGKIRPVDELETAGMKSAWGWCWDTPGVDNSNDMGSPWAPFYASHGNNNLNYKIPANYPGKTLGLEWTQRDLNKGFALHTGDITVFSMDPDDVRRGRIVHGRDAGYWKQLLDDYLRNTEWNAMVPFLMQQESHEMEWSFPWIFNEGDNKLEANWKVVNMDALAMDEFFKYAKSKNITFMTQPQFAAAYQKMYPATTPAHYMLCRDIPTKEPFHYYLKPFRKGPFPLTFQYFDADCQLAFHDQVRLPVRIFNYQHQLPAELLTSYPSEKNIPVIKEFTKESSPDKEVWRITLANTNPYAVPMGITEWGDFSKFEPGTHSPNVKEVKIIGRDLVFIRLDAAPDSRSGFTVEFRRKGLLATTRIFKPIKQLLPAAGLPPLLDPPCAAAAPEPLPAPVVWGSVGTGAVDSMPIGNGEIALNVWSEPSGDVVFYIARTDAWDENGRLLKLGRIRLSASPALDVGEGNFRQTLNLRDGRILIHAGTGPQAVDIDLAVDVNHPVVRIGMKSATPHKLKATLETWRKERRWVEEAGMTCWYMAGGYESIGMKVFSDGDVISGDSPDRLLWYHRNEESQWEFGLRHQGIFEAAKGLKDPLIRRTFGGIVAGNGFLAISPTEMESTAQKSHDLLVCLHTAQTDTPEAWQAQAAEALEQARKDTGWSAAHTHWWHDFWDRSYVRILKTTMQMPFAVQNEIPLRWGADSAGASRFNGYFGGLRLWSRALTEDEVKAAHGGNLPSDKSVAGEWLAKDFQEGALPDKSGRGQPMKAVGKVAPDNFADRPALLLNGNGFLEGFGGVLPVIDGPCSWECWFAPRGFVSGGARLIDKIPAATGTGFLLDTYPGGDGLRLLSRQGSMEKPAVLQLNTWHHVAAVYDGQIRRLFLDGKLLAADPVAPAVEDFAERLNLTYNLQRWISACAGRGQYPIKFNGSLFTIEPAPVNGSGLDPDFRQWGGEYWWQNTRLMYYPMLASGDFDLMKPLFAMYRAQLDLMKARTKTWYGVEGATMTEAGTFWGMWSNYDYGWKRPEGLPIGEMTNRFMWHYWFSGLELTWLMLEYYDHTNDRQFLEETLRPMAEQFLLYFDQRFPRDADGRLRIYPSQALETWQDAENPVTDIAGLKAVLDRLTKLPQLPPGLRERWLKLQSEIPPIPLGEEAGRTVVLPAGKPLEPAKNIENPELYPVFPFRQFSLGKDQFPIGCETYAARKNRAGSGWSQDGMQAAALGLRDETAGILIRNLDRAHPKFRLPVFWGPNYDWLPDQCHGGNFLNTLQMMLLQSDGDRILVAPAWPKNWEGEFKLHAAHNTVVEGRIEAGRISWLKVTPPERAKDVVPYLPR